MAWGRIYIIFSYSAMVFIFFYLKKLIKMLKTEIWKQRFALLLLDQIDERYSLLDAILLSINYFNATAICLLACFYNQLHFSWYFFF